MQTEKIALSDHSTHDFPNPILCNTHFQQSLAGAAAGCASAVTTTPFDVVKIRRQNNAVPFYENTFTSLKHIFKNEGVKGLYRGVGPTLAGYLPTWAIYFTMYESLKSSLANQWGDGKENSIIHVVSAMTAGATSSIAVNPLWVIRTRIMTQPVHPELTSPYYYSSTIDAFRTIRRVEGVRALYKGLGPSLIGVTHVAIQFPLYERLKRGLVEKTQSHTELYGLDILLASAFSKMVAGVCTYPHEVIRTRLQTQIFGISNNQAQKYIGILKTARVILAEEGVEGFYRGLGTNLLRTVPASAVTLLTYELILKYFETIGSG